MFHKRDLYAIFRLLTFSSIAIRSNFLMKPKSLKGFFRPSYFNEKARFESVICDQEDRMSETDA